MFLQSFVDDRPLPDAVLSEICEATKIVITIISLVTAATGTCGLYSVLGVDTCSMDSETSA